MVRVNKLFLIISMMFTANIQAYSQDVPVIAGHQNVVNPVDLIDVIRHMLKKQDSSSGEVLVPGVKNRSILPIIGYGPANGAVIGAAVSVTKLLGNPNTTQLSSALFSVSFTSKKLMVFFVSSDY
jgi:hypothetical protein